MVQVAVGSQIWNYEEVGSGKRAPVLVLHGWGRSGGEWSRMASELAMWSGRKIYVLDLPGFGGSNIPKVGNIDEYSNLVYELCKYLGIDKVIVIGHSLGGRVGIVLASKYSELIERLVLVDPAGVKPRSIKRVALKTLATIFAWIPSSIRARLVGGMMDDDYRNSPTLQPLYKAVVATDLTKYLRKIKCQTIVVWGELDPILPLSLTKVYRDNLVNRQIRVVWGADHDPHLTKYEQTLRILQESVE